MRILIIEDNPSLNKPLSEALNINGYQTDIAENLKDGEYYISIRNYDLVLSKWLLSDGLGLDIIARIKEKHPRTPIIIISDERNSEYELQTFKNGADDFVAQPIDIRVLVVRIEARLRFWGSTAIEIDELTINPDEEKITYKGQEIEVKGKPFEVLTHLARHRDQIVSKEQLLDAIWEEPELVTPNVIEVAINQIRQKMDKPLGIATIETVRRRGYRFCYPKIPVEN
ncbi:MAG: homeostatic response regulator transcription factor HsrA [Helicobacter sp.]|uniref:homeostatic response regulator transcription factor HsrA n=1 Tax=Helicobacter sp. 10-6591 TaxID=2004998 RepID=UPI000DCBE087|nr:homeostatic response regulator transcription factor HsrA [Helicobacter sp. 10-6591]MCI6217344.1 homeostatic response regulator transcription factor HsrA [Helicobacter sp.]MCI7485197.1 homeostatic response regulator transcription factor HsrA [Helicobacter sp.]MDD7567522.1 homeostatic response regulator transcription factor HsrA [Helicobacter sp.]MDY5741046.1 homeostatic response regulator transcription factor HsrA [Helicobacter sp.]RAX54351.1 DNA-binding response regulator [Helicobacter sp. 